MSWRRPVSSEVGEPDASTLTVKLSDHCVANGTDQAAGMRAAIAECLASGAVLECDVLGQIGLGSTVVIGDERSNSPQNTVLVLVGGLKVKATASMTALIVVSGTINTLGCDIEANGDNKANFSIYGDNFGRATFGRLHAYGATTSGIYWEPSGNNNAWSIEKVRVSGCGTKHTTTATVSARSSESGWTTTDDAATYSTWTLTTPLPAALTVNEKAAPIVVMGDGRYMHVRRVVDSTTIEILNENKAVAVAETVTILSAAINAPNYGDIGIFTIGNADVRDNPNAVAMAYGGYGGSISTWAQQNNYAGLMVVHRATGLAISHFYTEASGVWLVVRDCLQTTLSIGPGANADQTNWQGMSQSWMTLAGRNKQPLHWLMATRTKSPVISPPAIPVDMPELNPGTRNITPGTMQAYNRNSGNYAMRIDNNYNSVGQVMLACPESGGGITITLSLLNGGLGHTIEGASTLVKSAVLGSVLVTYWLEGTTWRVRFNAATI